MAGNVKVVLKSVWDDKGIKNALSSMNGISKGISTSFKAIGVAAAAATAVIAKFSSDSINSASRLQESSNAVSVAFGSAASSVLAIGESSAESLGLAKSEFNEAAVKFSAFAERIVGEGGNVAGFIGDISQRAADFASVFNIEVAEAMQVFQSGLSGEAEPLKRFGINLLDTEVKAYAMANGIGEVGRELTETEKVQARYGLLLESTAKTAGDFANTADSLANRQRILKASFEDVKAEVGEALLPAFEDLVGIALDDLLPVFKTIAEQAGPAVADVLKFVADVIKNATTEGTDLNTALQKLSGSFDLVFGAISGGTKDAEGFSDTMANLVYVIEWLVTTMASLIAFFDGFSYAADALARGDIKEFWKFLTTDTIDYQNALRATTNGVKDAKGEFVGLTGEANRFNNLDLANARNEMAKTANATSALGNQIAENNRQLYYAMHPELVDPRTVTTTTTTAVSSGPTQAERVASAIKDANKDIARATKRYNDTVKSAMKSYDKAVIKANEAYKKATESADIARGKALIQAQAENAAAITQINNDAAKKLASIVATSVNRLRDAFKSAVETNIADIFATDEVGQSVDNLVTNLRDRLAASKALLARSASLSSAGFSQTFIEQVVGAGLTAGNELAQAVLEATPETQQELKQLYQALETESESGMDTLSQTIYDGAGLATTALRQMYADTLTEQTQALVDQAAAYATAQLDIQAQFEEAMTDAAVTRDTALADAMVVYKDALVAAAEDFKNSLDEIETQFKEKIAELGKLKAALQADVDALQSLIDQKQALSVIASQTQTVVATTPNVPVKSPTITQSTSAPVINVNVKTDQTQSTTQVGKIIAKTVQKYTGSGGGGGIKVIAL